jgi:hypothetical protein
MKKTMSRIVPIEKITEKIYLIRGVKVMLDKDLAALYGVENKALKQAVRRNIDRFPFDFMFELSKKECQSLRSQNVTLKRGQHSKYLPFVFTEQGVAMLSSVLKSEKAVHVNIQIMRAFTIMRKMSINDVQLNQKIIALERKYDRQFQIVFEAIKKLMEVDDKPKQKIGKKWFQSLRSGSRARRTVN